MGGGAIRDPKTGEPITGRLPRRIYEVVKHNVLRALSAAGVGMRPEIVLELPGKMSFGDLDVLYYLDTEAAVTDDSGLGPLWTPEFCQKLKAGDIATRKAFVTRVLSLERPSHVVTNGHVLSCAVPLETLLRLSATSAVGEDEEAEIRNMLSETTTTYFQVDLIQTRDFDHMHMSRFYFSYSDVGSIIGRLTNFYALKFGDEGLWCELLENTVFPDAPFDVRRNMGRLPFSRRVEEVCTFLGISYEFWSRIPSRFQLAPRLAAAASTAQTTVTALPLAEQNRVAQELLDEASRAIFEWIASSRYFNRDIFVTLNSDHRARADKRPFYQGFLKFIGVDEVRHVSPEDAETGGQRASLQAEGIRYFKLEKEAEYLKNRQLLTRERQAKFSTSDLIQIFEKTFPDRPKLSGKDIGGMSKNFQAHCCSAAAAMVRVPASDLATTVSKPDDGQWLTDVIDHATREAILAEAQSFVSNYFA